MPGGGGATAAGMRASKAAAFPTPVCSAWRHGYPGEALERKSGSGRTCAARAARKAGLGMKGAEAFPV